MQSTLILTGIRVAGARHLSSSSFCCRNTFLAAITCLPAATRRLFLTTTVAMAEAKFTKEELQTRLTQEQFNVTQNKGTEAAFSGDYVNEKGKGMYNCIVCGVELFSSDTKFDSGSGWPSFTDIAKADTVKLVEDTAHGMSRTEVTCAKCHAHLGHVFDDGPGPTGQRFCINSCSLKFDKEN